MTIIICTIFDLDITTRTNQIFLKSKKPWPHPSTWLRHYLGLWVIELTVGNVRSSEKMFHLQTYLHKKQSHHNL